jgi:hypothetical protein
MPSLDVLVAALADAFRTADARRPQDTSRSGRAYQPGLGPHSENAAMALTLAELDLERLGLTDAGQFAPYPNAPRQKCDVWFGLPLEWVVEAKMARFRGDNGKPDDTALKDLLSPLSERPKRPYRLPAAGPIWLFVPEGAGGVWIRLCRSAARSVHLGAGHTGTFEGQALGPRLEASIGSLSTPSTTRVGCSHGKSLANGTGAMRRDEQPSTLGARPSARADWEDDSHTYGQS